MTRRGILVLTLTLVVFTATHLLANYEFLIVGTISKVTTTQLQVKTAQTKIYSIKLDSQTLVSRDNNKVTTAELKAGRTVVVDAIGDTEEDLLALEVRLVPALPK
jgi:hypothetical protein